MLWALVPTYHFHGRLSVPASWTMTTSKPPAGSAAMSTSRPLLVFSSELICETDWPTYHHHPFWSAPVFDTITTLYVPPLWSGDSETIRALLALSWDEFWAVVSPTYHHHDRAALPVFFTMTTLTVPSLLRSSEISRAWLLLSAVLTCATV